MTRIQASCSPGEIRIAVLDGDVLTAYAIWRPGCLDGFGNVYAARIDALVPAMAGAFADIGGAVGFLPDSDGAAGRSEGEKLAVRIVRTAQGGKGPRLSALPETPEAGPPRLLRLGPDPLHRLARDYPAAPVAVDDAAVLAGLRQSLGGRVWLVARAFDDVLETEIDALGTPVADLPGGMRATITPTPALTAIDIDGGRTTAARSGKLAGQLAANRAALPALARQIALRNLSGAILIDFAGLPIRRRAALAAGLQTALAADRARPRLLGFSHLGLAEILRPRSIAPLHEQLAGALATGLAALRRLAAEPDRRRPRLRAAPAVAAALQADRTALPDLARHLVHPLILEPDPTLAPLGWLIEDAA